MSDGRALDAAKRARLDEFYTQLSDIEKELRYYERHFAAKVVYCNCDDPRVSNFSRYFRLNFDRLGLKELVTTCYRSQQLDAFSKHDVDAAVGVEYDGSKETRLELGSDGDFRSEACIELLKRADVVVTNPPFSLFRKYVAQLVEHEKRFLIIGPMNAITYKEVFPLIRDSRMWLGRGFAQGNAYFKTPDPERYARGVFNEETGLVKFRNVHWFTNLDHAKRHEKLILYRRYSPEEYPKYDNYNAINVNRIAEIPMDYDGEMGVPVTFLDKHNPDQFKIVGVSYLWDDGLESHTFYDDYDEMKSDGSRTGMSGTKANGLAVLKGRPPNPRGNYLVRGDDVVHTVYKRIFVKRKDR